MDIIKIPVGYLQANCYLLIKENNCLIIDPGDEENRIVEEIKERELKPLAVLVTHHHLDHDKYAKDLGMIYGITVYDYHNLFEGTKQIGDFQFETIYTPGHTSDSITLYFPLDDSSSGVMFTGDFLFKGSMGRTDLETGNYKEMLTSLNNLKKYKDSDITIMPGHGDATTISLEFSENPYLREL